MRTPLRRVRGFGSSGSGTEVFWLQRVTAVANLPLVVAAMAVLVALAGRSHAGVVATLGKPWIAILMIATIVSIVVHMRIGMQVIIEDYVHSVGRKVVLLLANTFFAVAIGLAAIFALLRISFGV